VYCERNMKRFFNKSEKTLKPFANYQLKRYVSSYLLYNGLASLLFMRAIIYIIGVLKKFKV